MQCDNSPPRHVCSIYVCQPTTGECVFWGLKPDESTCGLHDWCINGQCQDRCLGTVCPPPAACSTLECSSTDGECGVEGSVADEQPCNPGFGHDPQTTWCIEGECVDTCTGVTCGEDPAAPCQLQNCDNTQEGKCVAIGHKEDQSPCGADSGPGANISWCIEGNCQEKCLGVECPPVLTEPCGLMGCDARTGECAHQGFKPDMEDCWPPANTSSTWCLGEDAKERVGDLG